MTPKRERIASIFSLLLGAAYYGHPASLKACSCLAVGTVCEAAWASKAVFLGKVTGVSDSPKQVQFGNQTGTLHRNRFAFQVLENFVGTSGKTIDVITGTGGGDCGIPFQVGQEYLVYAFRDSYGSLDSGICSRTAPVARAAEDLVYLRGLAKAESGARIFGFVIKGAPGMTFRGDSVKPPKGMANVSIRLESGVISRNAVTNPAGDYELSGLPAGSYTLSAAMPGLLGGGEKRAVELHDRACSAQNFVAIERAQITGKVVDQSHAPPGAYSLQRVEMAPVEHFREPKAAAAYFSYIEPTGDFTIPGLPAGDYFLGINITEPPGKNLSLESLPFPPTYYPGVTDRAQAKIIRVASAQQLTGFQLSLTAPLSRRTITGRVARRSGAPAGWAKVELIDSEFPGNAIGNGVVKDDGTFSVSLFAGRSYTLSASGAARCCNSFLQSEIIAITPSRNGPVPLTLLPFEPKGTSGKTLPRPTLLSPADKSVFTELPPRVTKLEWSPVPGAIKYGVEVDCGNQGIRNSRGGISNEWGWEVGAGTPCTRILEVSEPTYTFPFVGAQPGRWRVWAIGESGEVSQVTMWHEFRYTH